jgi:hypothetical protein
VPGRGAQNPVLIAFCQRPGVPRPARGCRP